MAYSEILNRYNFHYLESEEDCKKAVSSIPANGISILGFDTETNSKINMAKKRDEPSIDIARDLPFMLQFGYGKDIYIADLEKSAHIKDHILNTFDTFCQKSKLKIAQNITFDVHMLYNYGYKFDFTNAVDMMAISRLALESKSTREGGASLKLKPLAARILGSEYAELGKQIEWELDKIWKGKLQKLMQVLKPFGITRAKIEEILKDVTSDLDEFPIEVQNIWNTWSSHATCSYDEVPRDIMAKYGGTDVIIILELTKVLLPIVADRKMLNILKTESKVSETVWKMERTGYRVDKKYLIQSKQALIFEINSFKRINASLLGKDLKVGQSKAIIEAIYDKFGYKLETTDKNAINILMHTDPNMPNEVKEYLTNMIYIRTLSKFIATYINGILKTLNKTENTDSKVYTQFNSNGAVSGRFTSNFQQFPKQAVKSRLGDFELFHPRKMFIIESDEYPILAYIDFSQVELRLQAAYTYRCTQGLGDINMLRAYMPFRCIEKDGTYYLEENPSEAWHGTDVHTQTTATAFPDKVGTEEFKKLRSIGKRVNFALIYGAGVKKVKETLADVDPKTIEKLYYGFHETFKDVKVYQSWTLSEYVKHGYVENMFGRRYYINDSKDAYKLNNYLIQGSAADMFKRVLINLQKYIDENHLKSKIQGCIHDEVCFIIHKDEAQEIKKFKEIMETTFTCEVPLVAEISISKTNWGEKR